MRNFMIAASAALCLSAIALPALADVPPCEERSFMQPPLFYSGVEKLADGRVSFRLCSKSAKDVRVLAMEVAGVPTGLDGKPPGLALSLDDKGYWSATTSAPVAPGVYTYAFKVDGLRIADPQGTRFAESFGGPQSIFEIQGPETPNQFYKPEVPHGLVSLVEYSSASLGGIKRRAHVYTPPGYEAGGKERYPVLYLVHGYSDSDDAWVKKGNANAILDNLIATGKVKPMIVVMPYGHTPERAGVQGMVNVDFGADLHKELIPYIDAHFRTEAKPKTRAMAGLSMGGAHTLQFGLPRPDVFGSIGVFSIGLFGDQVTGYASANDAGLKARAKEKGPVFLAVGKEDFVFPSVAPVRKIMDDYGIKHEYGESGGGHTWINWRAYLEEFLPKLFR